MPFYTMAIDQFDEIPLGVSRQCRLGEVRVAADEIRGCSPKVREITTPSARNTDLFACGFGVINDQRARAGMGCAVQSSGTSAKDEGIYMHRCGGALKQHATQEPSAQSAKFFNQAEQGCVIFLESVSFFV